MQTAPQETAAIATKKAKPDRRWRRGLRHGLRTRRLPFQGGKAIEQYRNKYRVAIEDELLSQGREIGPSEATHVAAAVLAYEHSMKAGFWLANHYDELNHDQRLTFSREEMRGFAEAAKLLKSLGIDRNNNHDLWSSLHRTHVLAAGIESNDTSVQVAKETPDATGGRVEGEGGND
jgi:hypothetical protein